MKPINLIISMSAVLLVIALGALIWTRVAHSSVAWWITRIAFGGSIAIAFLPLLAVSVYFGWKWLAERLRRRSRPG
jgi:membrane protein implicated in regulation of membrane protease activity